MSVLETSEPEAASAAGAVPAHTAAIRKQRLVVIGNGMAPGRALEKLFEQAEFTWPCSPLRWSPRSWE